MNEPAPSGDTNGSQSHSDETGPGGGRFSVARLSSAFARLMSATSVDPQAATRLSTGGAEVGDEPSPRDNDQMRVTPELIVEGALFVGSHDGRPMKSSEIAAHIRDVDAAEVESLICLLNDRYAEEDAGYRIERVGAGFCMQIRSDLSQIRQRFRGRVRAAKLSPAAIEVLSLVAYRQPITGVAVNQLRGSRSHAILAQLVRRHLLSISKQDEHSVVLHYQTTDRFNRVFGVGTVADLPLSEDLDDS